MLSAGGCWTRVRPSKQLRKSRTHQTQTMAVAGKGGTKENTSWPSIRPSRRLSSQTRRDHTVRFSGQVLERTALGTAQTASTRSSLIHSMKLLTFCPSSELRCLASSAFRAPRSTPGRRATPQSNLGGEDKTREHPLQGKSRGQAEAGAWWPSAELPLRWARGSQLAKQGPTSPCSALLRCCLKTQLQPLR